MLRDELYLRETIKRFNEQGLVCDCDDESRKEIVLLANNMMRMLGFDKKDYRIKFDRTYHCGQMFEEVSLVHTI